MSATINTQKRNAIVNSRGIWAALGVVACGVALRVYSLDYGLPYIYVIDELIFIGRALDIIYTGDFNPHWFGHPGTTIMYLFALMFAGKPCVTGDVGPDCVTEIFYMARLSMVVFAAGSIYLVFLIGRRLADVQIGLLAAAMFAVAPLHAQHSRFARTDVPMTFFVLAGTWFVISIARTGRWRDYLWAGFLLGLGVATKYPALLLALVIVWAHVLHQLEHKRPVWTHLSRLTGAGLATLCGAFIGSPYLFIDFGTVWADLTTEATSFIMGAASDGPVVSLYWYLSTQIPANLGALGVLMVLAGIWSVIYRRDRGGSIILLFPVCFLIFISFLSLRWDRWVIPVLPFLGLLAAMGVGELFGFFRRPDPSRMKMAGFTVTALLMLAGPTIDSVRSARACAGGDTRTLASEWIMDNVPAGSAILSEFDGPRLPKGMFRYYWAEYGRVMRFDDKNQYFYMPLPFIVPHGSLGNLRDVGLIDRAKIDYIVLSSEYERRVAEPFHEGREALHAEVRRQIGIYEEIMDRYPLAFEASPVSGRLKGSNIRIYRVARAP